MVVSEDFHFFILLVTTTDITVWIISALLAVGIGLSKYAKWNTRNKLVRDLAAMDPERREKILSRMRPDLAMEAIGTIVPQGVRPPNLHTARFIYAQGWGDKRLDLTANAAAVACTAMGKHDAAGGRAASVRHRKR